MALLHTVKLWYIFWNRSISLAHKFLLMFWRLKKNNTRRFALFSKCKQYRSPWNGKGKIPSSTCLLCLETSSVRANVAADELVDGGFVMQSPGFGFFINCVFQQLPYGIVWGWNGCVQSVWPMVGTVTDFVFVEWLIAVLCDVSSAGSGWNHARKQSPHSEECWPFSARLLSVRADRMTMLWAPQVENSVSSSLGSSSCTPELQLVSWCGCPGPLSSRVLLPLY